MHEYDMPLIPLDELRRTLSVEDYRIVTGIVATRGKNKGRLRASKPKVTRRKVGDRVEPDRHEGYTAYVWRMVAFSISPVPAHQCLPCTADFDVPGHWGPEKREVLDYLDGIVDAVVKSVPVAEWHGVRRWGQVFGAVGTPQYNEEGAVIYR